jgi:DnaJ family protein C protein 13
MMNYYFISRLTLLLDHPKTFSVMALLQSLLSNNQVVSQCFSCGCFVVLLHIFASSAQHELRVKAALLLLSSIKNKVYGQKVVLIVEKFLPVTFIEVWRENIDSSVVMFDKTHENPELIWNDKIRQKVKDTLLTMKEEIYKSLQEENSSTWDFPESFQKVYLDNMDELMIGGVYVRLFNEHRGWPLRAPREFLIGCLEKFLELCGQPAANQSNLQLLGQGITKVVTLSSGLMDTIAPLGHIRRLIGAILDSKAPYQQRECYIVLSQLSESQSCVNAMTEVTITSALRTGMQSDIANIEPATKTLYNIMLRNNFTKPPGKFLKEALKQNFILFLLDVLNMSLVSASSKVYIVKSIKEMLKDEIFGEELQKIVELKPIWAQYKDQLHDLFISKHKEPGFLLDGETRDSQYLMDSTTIDAFRSPPPLDLQ